MPAFLRLLAIVATCLTLAACEDASVNPLSDLSKAQADQALTGFWQMVEDGDSKTGKDVQIIQFVSQKEDWSGIIWTEYDGKAKTYRMFPTKLGQFSFMNVVPIGKFGEMELEQPQPYRLIRYEISDSDTLKLWLIDHDWAHKAIKEGTLKGTMSPRDDDVILFDSTENLARVVLEMNPVKVFNKSLMTLKRLKFSSSL